MYKIAQFVGLPLSLMLTISAPAQPKWPEYLDIDFNYRNSARLEDQQRWDFRLGVGVESEPAFQGSREVEMEAQPFVVLAYRSELGNLFLTGGGLGYSRVFSNGLGLGLQLEAEDTREESDDPRLRGLGDQDEELELEFTGVYFLGALHLGGSVAAATGEKGVVGFVGATYAWRLLDDQLFLSIGGDLSASNGTNQRTDFGITQTQSDASSEGFPVYTPTGGLKSYGVRIAADYQLRQQWYVYGELEYERLLGDVADSPLVRDGGSRNALEAGIGFYYRFF